MQPTFFDELRVSVAQFNALVNQHLQTIGEVIVEGEITQMNVSARGGVNIVMKDVKEQAVINVSGYEPQIQGIKMVREGMQVAIYGIPQVWSPTGRLSVSIHKIVPLGEGALKEAYELLKAKLKNEGLFDESRKRPLPDYVTHIALITAAGSAALLDFLKILSENNSGLEIDFYSVSVQGKYSEREIIAALNAADTKEYDCIVLTRGGGSLEDLLTFNEEQVARAIFALHTPVLVAVGHERDESIADFVADVRASTPSQAAYYLVNTNLQFIASLETQAGVIEQLYINRLNQVKMALSGKLAGIDSRLLGEVRQMRSKLDHAQLLIDRFPDTVNESTRKLLELERLLRSLNPRNVLNRGFAIVRNSQGRVVSSKVNVKSGDDIAIEVKDGMIEAKVMP